MGREHSRLRNSTGEVAPKWQRDVFLTRGGVFLPRGGVFQELPIREAGACG